MTRFSIHVPTKRNLTQFEKEILTHTVSCFSFLLEVSPATALHKIDAEQLASVIEKSYETVSYPRPNKTQVCVDLLRSLDR